MKTKMIQQLELDGLNMIYLHGFVRSMKISWMQRFYKSSHAWSLMAKKNIPLFEDLRTYGSTKLRSIIKTLNNQFWKEVLEAWTDFFELYRPNNDQIITETLWFSDRAKFKNSIVKCWDTKGIRFIADLINKETGTLYSKNEIETIYSVNMTFLCYASLMRSLPKVIKTTNYKSKVTYPLIPYRISLMNGNCKMSRLAYREFQLSIKSNYRKAQLKLEQKWNRDIGHFQIGTMQDMHSVTNNTYLQVFHFRLISRIIPTKQFLHTIGISENNLCTFCSSSTETLSHLFWECVQVKRFIEEIKKMLFDEYNTTYNISQEKWFFPSTRECSEKEILITTIGKLTIYHAQNKNTTPSIRHFLNKLKPEVEKDRYIAEINGNKEKFEEKWGNLKLITS